MRQFIFFNCINCAGVHTACCVLQSMWLVASSKMRICGFLIRALARAIHCFCPADSWSPHSPTSKQIRVYKIKPTWIPSIDMLIQTQWSIPLLIPVSYPCSNLHIKVCALAFQAASLTLSIVQSCKPYSMLYLTVPENSTGSWDTIATWAKETKNSVNCPIIEYTSVLYVLVYYCLPFDGSIGADSDIEVLRPGTLHHPAVHRIFAAGLHKTSCHHQRDPPTLSPSPDSIPKSQTTRS